MDFMPEDLFPELEKKNIAGCIAVQADESVAETEFLLNLSQQHYWIKKVVGWIDFSSKNIETELEFFSLEKKLAGFRKNLQSLPPKAMEERDFLNGIGHLMKFGFTYDILIYPNHLEAAYQLVKKFPQQPFVLDHLAKPDIKNGEFEFWSKGIKKLSEPENVFCKVSGMVTEANWKGWTKNDFNPYLDFITDKFGSQRLMYGSDWPVCLLAASYEKVFDLAWDYYQMFSVSEQQAIFGGNAGRFYGL